MAVLTGTPPVRPAVYDLMGRLRRAQGRHNEAYDWHTKALEADPDYLGAMKRLFELREEVEREVVDWVALQNNMFRLDPLGRHAVVYVNEI